MNYLSYMIRGSQALIH